MVAANQISSAGPLRRSMAQGGEGSREELQGDAGVTSDMSRVAKIGIDHTIPTQIASFRFSRVLGIRATDFLWIVASTVNDIIIVDIVVQFEFATASIHRPSGTFVVERHRIALSVDVPHFKLYMPINIVNATSSVLLVYLFSSLLNHGGSTSFDISVGPPFCSIGVLSWRRSVI